MANRITTIIDFVTDGASRQISGFKAKIAEADTATGKMKAGFGATSDFIKANAASIATTAGAALVGFGAQAVKTFTETAIEADNLASLTGDTVEQSSRLNAIWKQSGADSKDLQDVLLQMNGVLSTNKGLVQQLGIDMSKSATVGQRFEEVAAALDEIPDAAKRSQIASQVFGEEGVRQYNALRTSVGDVSEAMEAVSEAQVIDEAEVDKARRLAETMKKAEAAIKDITMVVGEELAPELAKAAENMLWLKERADDLRGANLPKPLQDAAEAARRLVDPLKAAQDGYGGIKDVLGEGEVAADAYSSAQEAVTAAATEAAAATTEQAEATDALNVSMTGTESSAYLVDAAIDAAKSRINRFGEDGVENMGDVEEAADDVTDSVGEIRDELAGLRADIANDQSAIDLAGQFDQFRDSANEAWFAAASGAEDAEEKQRAYQSEINATKEAVIQYATEVLGLPAERVTEFVAMIDQGAADQVEGLLNSIARNRFARITPGTGGPAKFADGTYNAPGGMSVINDGNGPELVTLPSGAKVMTHANTANYLNQMGGGGGGESIVVNNKTINQYIQVTGDAEYVFYEAGRRARYME